MRADTGIKAWTVTVSSDLAGLKRALSGLERWLARNGVEGEAEHRARLVLEEIVTNISRYGFDDRKAHEIDILGRMTNSELTLTFDDTGRPFDPRSAIAPVPAANLAEAEIGGRGLLLVRTSARHMDYERTADGHNRLTVTLSRS